MPNFSTDLDFLDRFYANALKYHGNVVSGSRADTRCQTNMSKLMGAFRISANTPRIVYYQVAELECEAHTCYFAVNG